MSFLAKVRKTVFLVIFGHFGVFRDFWSGFASSGIFCWGFVARVFWFFSVFSGFSVFHVFHVFDVFCILWTLGRQNR